MMLPTCRHHSLPATSTSAGFRFPAEVTVPAGRYLPDNFAYPGVAEQPFERGIDVARFSRHGPGDRWYGYETSGKVNEVWRPHGSSAGRAGW
jgi:hypothetical protein